MDALIFSDNELAQWKPRLIDRELNKAYVTFYEKDSSKLIPIATGNWGCGAFAGDKLLKSVIQWIAASQAGRDTVYFTFGDDLLTKELNMFANAIIEQNKTIGLVFLSQKFTL